MYLCAQIENCMNMSRIEELIKEKGYTYTSLAEKMGTTKQNLYGKLKSPSYPTLTEIANALGVEMWELFATREEIVGDNFIAFIRDHGKAYEAHSVEELEIIINKLKTSNNL